MYEKQINQTIDPFPAQIAQKVAAAQWQSQGNVLGGEAMRMPELSREAERLEMLIAQVGQIGGQFDARLTPVLRGPIPPSISNQSQREANSSPFACRLAGMADLLEGSIALLRDLINRLEV